MMRRRTALARGSARGRRWAVALLLAVAAWQGGQGLWLLGKARLAQFLLERAWVLTEAQGAAAAVKPWPWADTWPVFKLSVPRLGVERIVLAGATGEAMAFGPAHVTLSAAPGEPGNSVVGGHRDTHFAFVRDLARGDRLTVKRPGRAAAPFVVRDLAVIDPGGSAPPGLRLQPDGHWLTLVTCWPFDALVAGGPGRYLVLAEAAAD